MKSVGVSSRSALWLGERKLSTVMLVIGGLLLVSLAVGLFSYLLIQDLFAFGSFPAGSSIVGANVSGLTKTEALEKCQKELAEVANRPLTLKIDGEEYQAAPDRIGLKLEYREMVDGAYSQAWSVNLFERMARRFLNRPRDINISLLAANNGEMVSAFLQEALAGINRHMHDAYIDVTSGVPVIVPAKDGRQADPELLLADTREALGTAERTVDVQVGRTPAAVTDAVFGQFIIINLAEHKLTLYNREQPLIELPIACGSARYPTPAGQWKITGKQRNPTWRNPGTAWAKSMPPFIAPGPGNPLGTRALPLNASGVLIHGTSASWSIGRSVSHGCIRMHMRDVEQLFEMVEANTPVYIIKAAGNPGFDVTAKPFWQK
ncbi:MAG: L,D-transpeptidase/peptidoglycan binding protein [Actinobacteria bacterium]|nr:L,D-transpeptidase/peptidoglycan binding protein [Actinomycetota bacterium]MBU4240671.1 L,D-transpeptidase/peptidoglycan binding protein [Actinomycetota bacterium]MBU4385606.1 L,D-transpeptidase/peptidoglycan binding protein [Actinomycetota bacterium]MBU4490204.1 L,D-transpeptidase/peptidoglycan binding protein [Actinomycetota bacterium]